MADRADYRPLEGKLALVTGAGIGIGQGVADELSRQGASVVIHYAHSKEGAEETSKAITERGGKARVIQADLQSVDECKRLVHQAADFLGGIDILVNNSGITARAECTEVSPEYFDLILGVNFRSHFFCAQTAIPYMESRGGGAIVNMSSIHAFAGVPSYSLYSSTKGAIVSFTRALAMELAPKRIRVNAIGPGHVEVDRHRNNPNYVREKISTSIPWGRVGEPKDIARTVAFLVSEEADFITGQMLYVDGGTTSRLSINPTPMPRPDQT